MKNIEMRKRILGVVIYYINKMKEEGTYHYPSNTLISWFSGNANGALTTGMRIGLISIEEFDRWTVLVSKIERKFTTN